MITNIEVEIENDKITADYISIHTRIVRPIVIYFFDDAKKEIYREQYVCKADGLNNFLWVHAHCQWPEDYCSSFGWEKYWEEKSGAKNKIGDINFMPKLMTNQKYSFVISCPVPQDTKFIQICPKN